MKEVVAALQRDLEDISNPNDSRAKLPLRKLHTMVHSACIRFKKMHSARLLSLTDEISTAIIHKGADELLKRQPANAKLSIASVLRLSALNGTKKRYCPSISNYTSLLTMRERG